MMMLSTADIRGRFRRQRSRSGVGVVAPSPTPERLMREQVAAFNRHDLDATMALFAPDCTWEVVGNDQTLTRDVLGFTIWRFLQHDAQIAIESVVAGGDTVVGEFVQTYRDDDRELLVSAPTVCVYTFAGGQIVRVRQYFHRAWEYVAAPAARVARPGGRRSSPLARYFRLRRITTQG